MIEWEIGRDETISRPHDEVHVHEILLVVWSRDEFGGGGTVGAKVGPGACHGRCSWFGKAGGGMVEYIL